MATQMIHERTPADTTPPVPGVEDLDTLLRRLVETLAHRDRLRARAGAFDDLARLQSELHEIRAALAAVRGPKIRPASPGG